MKENELDLSIVKCVIRGVLLSLIVTLFGILIFAFIIKIAYLNATVIKAVNQFIKILAVFLGCFFSLKNRGGLIRGALIGGIANALIYLLFALFLGQISFGFSFIADEIFSTIVGTISGVIAVNVKKR